VSGAKKTVRHLSARRGKYSAGLLNEGSLVEGWRMRFFCSCTRVQAPACFEAGGLIVRSATAIRAWLLFS